MTDRTEDTPTAAEIAEIHRLLASEAVWAESDPQIEAAILAEIAAESGWSPDVSEPVISGSSGSEDVPRATHDNVVPIRRVSRQRLFVGAAAVAVLFAAIGFGLGQLGGAQNDSGNDFEIAMVGTELAPGASATAGIKATSAGLRISLDVSGLDPAPEGTYYQAWIRNEDGGAVTAGTFHMRGGDDEIDLWTGVLMGEYPIITVTLQQEGEGPASSGVVVLKGRVGG
ncbi:MAG: anti-sigma factor [Acidimicrobiales bacterium]